MTAAHTHAMRYILIFVLFALSLTKAYGFSGGTGTEASPFLISTAEDMAGIPNNTTDYFALVNDITDCIPVEITFKGHLDGRNHTISINREYQLTNYAYHKTDFGLFNECVGAEIKNLKISGRFYVNYFSNNNGVQSVTLYYLNNTLYLDLYFAEFAIGALCGHASSSTFINCSGGASIEGRTCSKTEGRSTYDCWGSEVYIGGLVGNAIDCSFSVCSVSGKITSALYTEDFQGWLVGHPALDNLNSPEPCAVGGITGYALNTQFHDCFNTASIITDNWLRTGVSVSIGGICGYSDYSKMTCCYNSGTISGYQPSSMAGTEGSVTANNCFSALNTDAFPLFGCTGNFTNCYSVRSDNFDRTDATANSAWGESTSATNLSMQSWYATKMPLWDFNEKWYLPTGTESLPAFRIEPDITFSGNLVYGGKYTVSSSNLYKTIEITDNTPDGLDIDGNSITFKKSGIINLNIHQEAIIPYRPINRNISLNVSQAPLQIDGGIFSMNYGDEAPEFKPTYTGFLFNDDESILTKKPTLLCDASKTSDVGDYVIIVSDAIAENYQIIYHQGICHISPRELTATPMAASRKYGSNNPQFQIEYYGFVNGDNQSLVTTRPTVYTDADKSSDAGTYATYCKGGEIYKNYTLKYGTGALTIEKANLHVGVVNTTRAMGEINPAFELTFDGFKNDDDKFSLDEWPSAVCTADENSPAVQYPIELQGGSDHNYNYVCSNGILTVTEFSGIESPEIDIADETMEIFTLTGQKVMKESLSPGIYIIATQKGFRKVAIK